MRRWRTSCMPFNRGMLDARDSRHQTFAAFCLLERSEYGAGEDRISYKTKNKS